MSGSDLYHPANMPSDRVQRQIELLLDQAAAALAAQDWRAALQAAEAARGFDPENADAAAFGIAAERAIAAGGDSTLPAGEGEGSSANTDPSRASGNGLPPVPEGEGGSSTPSPTSFAGDRYQVSKFLGEGGRKRVYQAHDTLLDRDVAFALIKTEGFDQTSMDC